MKIDKKIIALLAFFTIGGIASAALVNVISNTITASVTTRIPLELRFVQVSNGLNISNDGTTVTGEVPGGSSVWAIISITNHANNPIEMYPVVIISSDKGLSEGLKEIVNVSIEGYNVTDKIYCVNSDGMLTPLRNCSANNSLELFYDYNGDGTAQPYIIGAGTTLSKNVTLTLNPQATNQTITAKLEVHYTLP
jgi:hypothetical protein